MLVGIQWRYTQSRGSEWVAYEFITKWNSQCSQQYHCLGLKGVDAVNNVRVGAQNCASHLDGSNSTSKNCALFCCTCVCSSHSLLGTALSQGEEAGGGRRRSLSNGAAASLAGSTNSTEMPVAYYIIRPMTQVHCVDKRNPNHFKGQQYTLFGLGKGL